MVVSIKPLFYVSEMAVRPLSLLPRPSKGPDGSSTRLGAQDTSYGWTGGDDEAANYTPQTTFRIFPNALVGKSVLQVYYKCTTRVSSNLMLPTTIR